MVKYSIVIGTYNHCEDCLKPCIESLLKYTNMSDKELIVVANGCTDGTKEYLSEISKRLVAEGWKGSIEVIWKDKPLGFALAYNLGIVGCTGEKIILLNNDTVLLPQDKDEWIRMLESPFVDPKVGITGPIKQISPPVKREFIVFFCVMIRKDLFEKVGLLDTVYNPGGGEDTEFCIRSEDIGYSTVQVPSNPTRVEGTFISGGFPIYHKGEVTMNDNPKWQELFDRNSRILAKRFDSENYKLSIMNNYERAVFLKYDEILPREKARYEWASNNLAGKKILEIGCSNGYGTRLLPKDIEYTGIDYDERIVLEANETYGDEDHRFLHADINQFEFEYYDTIIAFEVLEHIPNGREMAQKLKKHCKTLLCSAPYMETVQGHINGKPVGIWGIHHVLHDLKEEDFPGFEYSWILWGGEISNRPVANDGTNLLLMKWTNGTRVHGHEMKV